MRLLAVLFVASGLFAQSEVGELRLAVVDATNLPVPSHVELTSSSNDYRLKLDTDAEGKLMARRVPFGRYTLRIEHAGFAPYSALVEIRSAIPLETTVPLSLSGVETTLVVSDSATLVDPHRTGASHRIGADTLRDQTSAAPGRSVVELINQQPGWLLEANAVLHPRGSEYQTQYVVNGMPITDNRSPAFAPEFEADDVQSMNVMTANYPAEYGRKLGGVIEVNTARDARAGFHGKAAASGGSFDTAGGYLAGQYGWARSTFTLTGQEARTSRYLDPPVEENFNNSGTTGSWSAHYERDWTDRDRIGLLARREQSRFLVPNELTQQTAGQRQDRSTAETVGQLSYQHIFSPQWIGDVRAMARDLSGALWSNTLATPIIASQDRGFREAYVKASASAHLGDHELKFGADADFASVNEAFAYRITNRRQFDRDTPRNFAFADRRQDREQSWFAQDLLRIRNWTFSAGIRYDHYRLAVDEDAWSPRLAAAYYWRAADLVLRASWDRAFQTPAIENILLASSPAVSSLNDSVLRLPLRPSRGDFLEVGFTKGIARRVRLDGSYFRRAVDNFADDDLLLNTGVSFPISFRRAEIHGVEAKLEIPRWGPFSGFISYSNLLGVGYLPVTGGFFLGDEAAALLDSTDRFAISQDQRNTVQARVRWQISSRLWTALSGSYGSGLPVEFEGDQATALAQYGQRIVDRVNFDRGRIRPSFSLDASAGFDLHRTERLGVRLQADIRNLTDRLNVINFAGLFSGTAVAAPRTYALRLVTEF
jgi:outer membrane cobalamin receptor